MLKKLFEHLQTVPGGLSQLIVLRKVSQNLLSPWEQIIFEKILALDLLGPRDNFLSIAKKLLNKQGRPSQNVSWPLLSSIKWEKNMPKSFLYWKVCLFSKNFWIQQPPRSWRFHLITNSVMVKNFEDPYKLSFEVCHTR